MCFDNKLKRGRTLLGGLLLIMGLFSFGLMGCSKDTADTNNSDKKGYVVGGKITQENFKEFYYTDSATTNPPRFQRYVFSMKDGKAMFYHEKREGDTVFLTEEDITVSGSMELSEEEWNAFWGFIDGCSVAKRSEDASAGGGSPWLYIYWDGDKDKYQEFSFNDYNTILSFEKFCEELKEKQLNN